MGEAKRRGTFEERKALAIKKAELATEMHKVNESNKQKQAAKTAEHKQ
jgi:hypothetical protein